jgi:hypothetical protein
MNRDINMNFDDIIYNDENVTVTLTSLRIGQKQYNFSNISSFRLVTLSPDRKPFIALTALGSLIAVVAQLNFIPHFLIYNLQFNGYAFSQINLITGFGILLSIIGLLVIVLRSNKYALNINSGGNEMNILVSKRKGYIKAVAGAIGIGLRCSNKSLPSTPPLMPNSLA